MAHPKKKTSLSKSKKRRTHYKRKCLLPLLFYNKKKEIYQIYHNVKIEKVGNKIIYYYKNKKIIIYK